MQSETTLTFPISFELPTDLKVRICDAITLFSRVESAALEAVWTPEHADLIRKKKIARMSAKNGFKALRGFFAGVTEAQESRLWATLDGLTNERNLIAHG